MPGGRLITIEGIDGAGKTTLAEALQAELGGRGVDVRLLREPGGVAVAERIRELVKDSELRIGARAEALLYAAARAQLVEEAIDPLLEQGTWVLLDRFVDSSLAYQGAGRGLGVDAVRAINEFGTRGLRPDRTLLLVLDARTGRERSKTRAEPVDRLEPSRTSSSSGSPRRISSSPPRTRSGSGRSTPSSLRTVCSRPRSRSSPTYSDSRADGPGRMPTRPRRSPRAPAWPAATRLGADLSPGGHEHRRVALAPRGFRVGISFPVTDCTAAITSRTENPFRCRG